MDQQTIPRPNGYQSPMSAEAHAALDQLESLLHTQLYNIQQCGLCNLDLPTYRQRAEQMMQLVQLLRQHFPHS